MYFCLLGGINAPPQLSNRNNQISNLFVVSLSLQPSLVYLHHTLAMNIIEYLSIYIYILNPSLAGVWLQSISHLIIAGIGPGIPGPSVTHISYHQMPGMDALIEIQFLFFDCGCVISFNISQTRKTMATTSCLKLNIVASNKIVLANHQFISYKQYQLTRDLVLLPLNSEN